MATVTWAELVAELPASQLSIVAPGAQTAILAFVHEVVSVTAFGGESSQRLRRARMTLAAHLATIGATGGTVVAGPVISESTSKISRTYAQVVSGGDFSGSSYGQEFSRLARTSPGARLPRVF